MSELNNAYAVLGDKSRRAEYDRTRKRSDQAEFGEDDNEYQSEAFTSALGEVEDRWNTACGIFPDLQDLRARLNKISSSLAFAFVTGLLETKAFKRRKEMASHLEQVFLERYFGNDSAVMNYARSLVFEGHKAAAKALNRLVDVMGADVDANLLISRIERDFKIEGSRKHAEDAKRRTEDREAVQRALEEARHRGIVVEELVASVLSHGHYKQARKLTEAAGYLVLVTREAIFFKPDAWSVKHTISSSSHHYFDTTQAFVSWVKETLCSPQK